MNIWLFVLIQALTSAVLGFIGMVVILSMGMFSGKAIIACFVVGFALSFPVAWFVSKRMSDS